MIDRRFFTPTLQYDAWFGPPDPTRHAYVTTDASGPYGRRLLAIYLVPLSVREPGIRELWRRVIAVHVCEVFHCQSHPHYCIHWPRIITVRGRVEAYPFFDSLPF